MPVKTCTHGAFVLPELGNDRLLTFLNNKKPCSHPDHKDNPSDQPHAHTSALHIWLEAPPRTTTVARTTATAVLGAKKTSELLVEVAPKLIKVGRLSIARPLITAPISGWRRRSRTLLRTCTVVCLVIVAAPPPRVIQIEHAPNTFWQRSPAYGAILKIHAQSLWVSGWHNASITNAIQRPRVFAHEFSKSHPTLGFAARTYSGHVQSE